MYLRIFADFNEQRFSRKFSQTINWKRKNKKAIADGLLIKKVADKLFLKLDKLVSQFS